MSLPTPVRGVIAVVATAAMVAGSSVLAGPALSDQGSQQSARTSAALAADLPRVDPDYQMPKIPVWVRVGDKGLGGVTVAVRDAQGKTRVTARTNTSGVVLIPRTFLRGDHSLTVTGGDAWKRLGKPALSTGELIGNRNAVVIISPLTSIAHRVAQRTGISYISALKRTREAHGIASHVDHFHAAATDLVFHTGQLRKWSKKHGGLQAGMDHLAKQIAKGKAVPSFRPKQKRQTRDAASTEAWVGEQIMSGVLSGSGSKGASIVIGDLFGADDPTAAELSSINSELSKIVTELATIEATLQQLVYLMEQTSFQVLNAGMADVAGAVNGNGTGTGLWAVYLSATTLDPTSPSYEADLSGFAASFYNGVYSILPTEVGELFDTPTSPGLLHQIYNFNTAPWWNSDDIASISSIIDYYGTIQAQAVALINEAWWSPNPQYQQTPDDINTFNTSDYGPQSTDIYLSMPTQITDSQVALPKTQSVYQLFPKRINTVYEQKTGNYTNELPTCSNDGQTVGKDMPYPTIDNNKSNWDDTWASAIPAGWTVQQPSILNDLGAARKLPNSSGATVTTYTLSNLVQAVPDAFAMVTSGQYPRAGYVNFSGNNSDPAGWGEWMFCYNAGVPLDDLTNWQTNFEAVSGGTLPDGYSWDSKHVPAGAPTNWIDLPIPVGVLGAQPGSFKYVAPTS